MRSVTTALEQANRSVALNQALNAAKAQQVQGSFDEALGTLLSFTARYGEEPAVEELSQTIEQNREGARRAAELREMVLRINQLLSQGKAEEATRILQTSPTPIKDHPELTRLRMLAQEELDRQLACRNALDLALNRADASRQEGDFDEARKILSEFTARYGDDPKIAALEQSIRQDSNESQRRAEEFRRLLRRANEFLAEGKATEATQLLQSRPAWFKDHPEVTRILEAADLQVRKQAERESALQAALSSAAACQQQGHFVDALAVLDIFVREHGPDGRVTALERIIRSNSEAARHAEEIRELETRARSLLAQKDFAGVAALLKQSPSLVNESLVLGELLSNAQAALAAEQTREFVDSTVSQARSRANGGDFQAALAAIDAGLKRFPSEGALKSARAEILSAQAAKQREEYRDQVIAEVNSLVAKHDYNRAFRLQEEALAKLPGDPRILGFRTEVEAHQRHWEAQQAEQKIQSTIARARELRTTKPAESAAILERLYAQHPDRQELTTLLAEAREGLRQRAERELIREAERLSPEEQIRRSRGQNWSGRSGDSGSLQKLASTTRGAPGRGRQRTSGERHPIRARHRSTQTRSSIARTRKTSPAVSGSARDRARDRGRKALRRGASTAGSGTKRSKLQNPRFRIRGYW